jgi:Trp operon repressor
MWQTCLTKLLAQNRAQWLAFVKMVMKHHGSQKAGNFLTS